jgi:hypothetical protein
MARRKAKVEIDSRVETLRQVAQEVDAELVKPELTPERIALAYKRVFEGLDGEIVLEDLKAKFNGTTVRMRPSGIDPYEVVHREGQRSLYLYLVEYRTPPPKPTTEETE